MKILSPLAKSVSFLIPFGSHEAAGFEPIPGKLDEDCIKFIGLDLEVYAGIDALLLSKKYHEERNKLVDHFLTMYHERLVSKTVNDIGTEILDSKNGMQMNKVFESRNFNIREEALKREKDITPPIQLRNYIFSPEELDIMSRRSTVGIEFTGTPNISTNDIVANGGLIPVKSPIRASLPPEKSFKIMPGIKLNIPDGYVAVIYGRKSMEQTDVTIAGQIIHSTHKDEIEIYLYNRDKNRTVDIHIGEEIAQIGIQPIKTNFIIG